MLPDMTAEELLRPLNAGMDPEMKRILGRFGSINFRRCREFTREHLLEMDRLADECDREFLESQRPGHLWKPEAER